MRKLEWLVSWWSDFFGGRFYGGNISRDFDAYPNNHAPLWFWDKALHGKQLYSKTGYPGHSPSDSFTLKQAKRYFSRHPKPKRIIE